MRHGLHAGRRGELGREGVPGGGGVASRRAPGPGRASSACGLADVEVGEAAVDVVAAGATRQTSSTPSSRRVPMSARRSRSGPFGVAWTVRSKRPGPPARPARSRATARRARTGRSRVRRLSPRGTAATTRPPQATAASPTAATRPRPVATPTAAPAPGQHDAERRGHGPRHRRREEPVPERSAISRWTLLAGPRRWRHPSAAA